MLESTDFYYDGVYSVDEGIYNVKISSGLYEEPFIAEREIIEEKIPGRDKPYFQRVEISPLSFNLSFYFKYKDDEEKVRKVARWLSQDYYKPFYTSLNPNRIFYCMPVGEFTFFHNGLKEGYVSFEMRCNSPYSYSPQYTKENIEYGTQYETYIIDDQFYKSDTGTYENIEIVDGNLKLNKTSLKWSDFQGKKWGDIT